MRWTKITNRTPRWWRKPRSHRREWRNRRAKLNEIDGEAIACAVGHRLTGRAKPHFGPGESRRFEMLADALTADTHTHCAGGSSPVRA